MSDGDYALALQLSYDEEAPKTSKSSISSSNSNSSSSSRNVSAARTTTHDKQQSSKPSIATSPASSSYNTLSNDCYHCKKGLVSIIGSSSYIKTGDGRKYHANCFVCNGCNRKLSSSYSLDKDMQPYHLSCYQELFGLKCTLCCGNISGQYRKHPFFDNEMYCMQSCIPKIDSNNIGTCSSCNRKELKESNSKSMARERFVALPDGRKSCNECIQTAIFDSSELIPLYTKVLQFFSNNLQLSIPKEMYDIPVLAVDITCLNESRSTASYHGDAVCRGLTISSMGEIRHIRQGCSYSNGRLVHEEAPVTYRIEKIRDVTAILVLYGFPLALTTSILAHEAFHAYLKLSKSFAFHLPSKVEEGMCQYIASEMLDKLNHRSNAAAAVTDAITMERKLNRYFKYQIENDTSTVYGDGYRECAKAVNTLGLDVVLEYIATNKVIPRV